MPQDTVQARDRFARLQDEEQKKLQEIEKEEPGTLQRVLAALMRAKPGGTFGGVDPEVRADLILSTPRGVIKGTNQALQTAENFVAWTARYVTAQLAKHPSARKPFAKAFPGGEEFARLMARDDEPLQIPNMYGDATTVPGAIATGLVQFTTGLLGVGKFGLAAKGAKLGTRLTLQGLRFAVVEGAFFDPYEQKLFGLAENIGPAFSEPMFAYLGADEDDPVLLARAKAGLEGFVFGATAELTIAGVKVLKAKYRVRAALHREGKPFMNDMTSEDASAVLEARIAKHKAMVQGAREQVKPGGAKLGGRQQAGLEHAEARKASALAEAEARKTTPGGSVGETIRASEESSENALMRLRDELVIMDELEAAGKIRRLKAGEIEAVPMGDEWTLRVGGMAKPRAVDPDLPLWRSRGEAEAWGAPLADMVAKRKIVPGPQLTPDVRREVIRRAEEIAKMPIDDIIAVGDEAHMNLNYFAPPNETTAMIAAMAEAVDPTLKRTVRSTEVTRQLARDLFGSDAPEEVIPVLRAAVKTQASDDALVLATRDVMKSQASNISRLNRLATFNPQNPVMQNEFQEAFNNLREMVGLFDQFKSQQGRSLRAHQIPVSGEVKLLPGAKEVLREARPMTPGEFRAFGRMLFAEGDTPNTYLTAARGANWFRGKKSPRWTHDLIGTITAGLVSSPPTHIVNMSMTYLAGLERTFLHMGGGLIRGAVTRGNYELAKDGVELFFRYHRALRHTAGAMRKSWRLNMPILDPTNRTVEQMANKRLFGASRSRALRRFGKFAEVPFRALTAEDEWFKLANYRAFVEHEAVKQSRALGEGPILMGQRIRDNLRAAFSDSGKATYPRGLEYARINTFTNDLRYGAKWMQDAVNAIPLLRLSGAYFMRTPINLVRAMWQRTPGAAYGQRQWREAFHAGGEAQAIALAQQVEGLIGYGLAWTLAASGHITGRSPQNKNLRRLFMQINRPYSWGIPGTSLRVGFGRLDPWFAPLGFVADGFQVSGEMAGKGWDPLRMGIVGFTTMAQAAGDKTYWNSLFETLDVMSDTDPNKVTRFFAQRTNQLLPYSALARNFTRLNATVKDATSYSDYVFQNMPGFSATVPASHNWLGEEILRHPALKAADHNPLQPGMERWVGMVKKAAQKAADLTLPVYFWVVPDDPLNKKVYTLGRGFEEYPEWLDPQHRVSLKDMDLFPHPSGVSPYDRVQEIVRSPDEEGMTARARANAYVFGKGEDSFDQQSGGTPAYLGGERHAVLRNIMNARRAAAEVQMTGEPGRERARDAIMYFRELAGLSFGSGQAGADSVNTKYSEVLKWLNP